jgi:hypothetical protein
MGLWLNDDAAKAHAAALRARGKNGGVIACALAHRANRIASALVRDQAGYDPHPVATAGLTTPLHNSGRRCQARGHEGPGPDAESAMADPQGPRRD